MTERVTCESCAHWNPVDYNGTAARAASYGVDEPGLWGTCVLIGDYDRTVESPRAFTRDSSDYKSWLMVRSDFSCIEHQEPS